MPLSISTPNRHSIPAPLLTGNDLDLLGGTDLRSDRVAISVRKDVLAVLIRVAHQRDIVHQRRERCLSSILRTVTAR